MFVTEEGVYRGLSPSALAAWERLAATKLWRKGSADGSLVATEKLSLGAAPDVRLLDGSPPAGVLRHQRISPISYPYEWSFSMLKDAALLHLRLLQEGLDEGLMLKDGTAYNVAFDGARPVFIDIGSFEPHADSGPWPGYRQFCQTMLFPLMLRAYRDLPHGPWLKGDLEGITPTDMARLLSRRDRMRRGVLRHVVAHRALERRVDEKSDEVRQDLAASGFSGELAKAAARGMERLVSGLDWKTAASTWTAYRDTCTYSDEDADAKSKFVRDEIGEHRPTVTIDLGTNDGRFALLAAEGGSRVVAVDSDEASIEQLYRRLKGSGALVTPLVMDLTDPSPARGWAGEERGSFTDRVQGDMVLALALVHHLALAGNVPLPAIVDWLARLGPRAVVEFVEPDDPQARRLLANKPPGTHDDYTMEGFVAAMERRYQVVQRVTLPSGTRHLFTLHRR